MAPASRPHVPPKPPRPFTEYHIFSQLERNYILQTSSGEVDTTLDFVDVDPHAASRPPRYRSLILPAGWHAKGSRPKRRCRRKAHGKISFVELTKQIARRWREADVETRAYCREVAQAELARYRQEMLEYTERYGEAAARMAREEKRKTVWKGRGSERGENNNKKEEEQEEGERKKKHPEPRAKRVSHHDEAASVASFTSSMSPFQAPPPQPTPQPSMPYAPSLMVVGGMVPVVPQVQQQHQAHQQHQQIPQVQHQPQAAVPHQVQQQQVVVQHQVQQHQAHQQHQQQSLLHSYQHHLAELQRQLREVKQRQAHEARLREEQRLRQEEQLIALLQREQISRGHRPAHHRGMVIPQAPWTTLKDAGPLAPVVEEQGEPMAENAFLGLLDARPPPRGVPKEAATVPPAAAPRPKAPKALPQVPRPLPEQLPVGGAIGLPQGSKLDDLYDSIFDVGDLLDDGPAGASALDDCSVDIGTGMPCTPPAHGSRGDGAATDSPVSATSPVAGVEAAGRKSFSPTPEYAIAPEIDFLAKNFVNEFSKYLDNDHDVQRQSELEAERAAAAAVDHGMLEKGALARMFDQGAPGADCEKKPSAAALPAFDAMEWGFPLKYGKRPNGMAKSPPPAGGSCDVAKPSRPSPWDASFPPSSLDGGDFSFPTNAKGRKRPAGGGGGDDGALAGDGGRGEMQAWLRDVFG